MSTPETASKTLGSKKGLRAKFAPAEDIRGRKVVDLDGKPLGAVVSLIVDDAENRVRFLRVGSGGFLGFRMSKALIPIESVDTIEDDVIHVSQKREKIMRAPPYDPAIIEGPYFAGVYRYYGYAPYWGSGYVEPSFRMFREIS